MMNTVLLTKPVYILHKRIYYEQLQIIGISDTVESLKQWVDGWLKEKCYFCDEETNAEYDKYLNSKWEYDENKQMYCFINDKQTQEFTIEIVEVL